MKLVLHRRIRSDVDEIMEYYERAEHPELAQDFYHELRGFMLKAARRPSRHHFFKGDLEAGEPQTVSVSLPLSSRRGLRARPRRPAQSTSS